jgi:hypothetical protein
MLMLQLTVCEDVRFGETIIPADTRCIVVSDLTDEYSAYPYRDRRLVTPRATVTSGNDYDTRARNRFLPMRCCPDPRRGEPS